MTDESHARRIHIVGASGSGTTTLGRTLERITGWPAFDADDFYWLPTEPPYRDKRAPAERAETLFDAVRPHARWILSGSLVSWGVDAVLDFTDVIFLTLDPEVRMRRLLAREVERYGTDRIAPGGDMHDAHVAFVNWAAAYDTPGNPGRSRSVHEAWIAALPSQVRVYRLDSAVAPDALAAAWCAVSLPPVQS